jgi:hypothetical protein
VEVEMEVMREMLGCWGGGWMLERAGMWSTEVNGGGC